MNTRSPVIVALLQGGRSVTAALNTICSEFELSTDEWLVVDALAEHEHLSMADLSTYGIVHGATLTRTVDRLVAKACVYRSASDRDRRVIEVRLSKHGLKLHKQLSARVAELESAVDATLTAGALTNDPATALRRLTDVFAQSSSNRQDSSQLG